MKPVLPGLAAIVALSVFHAAPAGAQSSVEQQVMRVDDAYRIAKLNQDTAALDQILAAGFNETNQNGNSRDKAQTIELWRSFSISSLTTDSARVRISGDTAMVTGTQTENGAEHMLFTRVYVNAGGNWQLLSSMQFRDPNPSPGSAASRPVAMPAVPINDVMKADEAYRVAKLKQDTAALERILDPAFNETNQNGNSRDKAETIELWRSFSIGSLTTDTAQVRISGDTAMVIGTQTENGYERMLFTRVYVRRPAGWLLLASMQYRNPNAGPTF
jgi:CYTH domain-containing protein